MNAVARDKAVELSVVYLHSTRPGRQWVQLPLEHNHLVLDGDADRLREAEKWLRSADFAVIGYYQDAFAHHLLSSRAKLQKPWCFWGERMGVSSLAWAGPLARRWTLRALHGSRAAIWGIGEFALSRYRREFGTRRTYCNVPYFSDLRRFAAREPKPPERSRVILCSGSLIRRKGVDTLAMAFKQLADAYPHLRLVFLGDGEERGRLESLLSDHRSQVDFVGFRSWSELPDYYRRADLLCVPSRHDGWGLVVAEGLAAGLPVIGTDRTGATLDLINEGLNGWVIRSSDVSSLAGVLRKAATLHADELATMSSAAVTSIANHQISNGVERFKAALAKSLLGW